jgi:hypothetical protein
MMKCDARLPNQCAPVGRSHRHIQAVSTEGFASVSYEETAKADYFFVKLDDIFVIAHYNIFLD